MMNGVRGIMGATRYIFSEGGGEFLVILITDSIFKGHGGGARIDQMMISQRPGGRKTGKQLAGGWRCLGRKRYGRMIKEKKKKKKKKTKTE